MSDRIFSMSSTPQHLVADGDLERGCGENERSSASNIERMGLYTMKVIMIWRMDRDWARSRLGTLSLAEEKIEKGNSRRTILYQILRIICILIN